MEKRSQLSRGEFLKSLFLGSASLAVRLDGLNLTTLSESNALYDPNNIINFAFHPHSRELNPNVLRCKLDLLLPNKFQNVLGVGATRHGFISIMDGQLNDISFGEENLEIPGVYTLNTVRDRLKLEKKEVRELERRKIDRFTISQVTLIRPDDPTIGYYYNIDDFRHLSASARGFEKWDGTFSPKTFLYKYYKRSGQNPAPLTKSIDTSYQSLFRRDK